MKIRCAHFLGVAMILLVSIDLYTIIRHLQVDREEREAREKESQAEVRNEQEVLVKVMADIAAARQELTNRNQADQNQLKTIGHLRLTAAEQEKRAKLDALRTHYIRSLQDHWYNMNEDMRMEFKQKYEADKQAIEDGDLPPASDDSH